MTHPHGFEPYPVSPTASQHPGPPQQPPAVPLAPPHVGHVPRTGPKRRRSLTASLAWLGGWSLASPVVVMATGVLVQVLMWVFAMALVVVTLGFIATDPEAEAWITEVTNGDKFDALMARLVPWAFASLFATFALGAAALLALRRTSVATWHPAGQGLLGAAAAFPVLLAVLVLAYAFG